MDTNNWKPNPPGGEPAVDTGDWRAQLPPDSRLRIVNKIMETLKRHLPFSGQEGLLELKKIAVRFEEKIYSAAISQQDYLRKISLKMLTMENKSQNTMPNPLPSNSPSNSNKPPDPAPHNMQSQLHNQGQSLPMQLPSSQQARQQLLSQNIQNNIGSPGVQGSAGLALPSVPGLSQAPIPNVVSQNSNMQNISNVSQNAVGNSMGHGMPSNMFTNSQRPMVGRQQVVGQQQQQQQEQQPLQQQSQNTQSHLYQQQLLMKQKFQQGNLPHSLMQSHIQQQQNILQPQLQSSQQSGMQTSSIMHPSLMQSAPIPSLQQNQQSSVQQATQSMLQQHQQPVLRPHQQPQQAAGVHQQQTPMAQQALLHPQQQQQIGQQANASNMQQNQLIGSQNNAGDLQQQQQRQQQQRLLGQQNNLQNMHQQQQQQLMAQQNNLPGMHQQQLGQQSNISGLSQLQPQQHSGQMLQPSKVPMQQQNSSNLLPTQGQQSQPQPSQQLLMSQMQSQPVPLQQQPNPLQRDMQQRIQASGSLLQAQNVIDQKKQLYQSQRALPETSSTSLDSTAETAHANGADWQEEGYQKIKAMKETYLPELNEMHQKIAAKFQQNESLPQQPKPEQLKRLKVFKAMLEQIITFLQAPKPSAGANFKEKLDAYEKQIINFIKSNRPKKAPSQQLGGPGQLLPTQMHSMQQSQSQITQIQSHENPINPQAQSMNLQGSAATMQQNSVSNLQHSSLSQQNMMNSLQPGSNLDSGQGNALNSILQVPVGSVQQNPVNAPQHANMNALSTQSGVTMLQQNINPLHSNSNVLQHQHLKQQQEQKILQTQQYKQQYQQRQMQQQFLQQQQQQLHQPARQQMPVHQMAQLHQMNDVGEMKMRQGIGAKQGMFQQHLSASQRQSYPHQQLKSGASFPISSPQLLQAASPQMPQHSSPQIDQQNLLSSLTKSGTPLQSANSPFVIPSPPTPLAPSPMPGESEKPISGISSNTGNIGPQQTTGAQAPAQSLAIGTPGISASPLLAEFTSPDGVHGNTLINVPGKSSVTEQPIERLIKAVKSVSPHSLSASVSDIGSVVSMIDRIAGSAPGNGSRAAVGEDLVAMTKCRLQARNFITQDGVSGTKRMRRYTSAMPLSVVSSAGSDSFKQLSGLEASDLESTASSSVKRPRIEANHSIQEELREINQQLIDTVVDISDEDVDPTVAAEGGEGTIVKCSFSAVALSPNLKSQYASAKMSPIQPLRLLIPVNYPNCSPILLDKFPVEISKEYEDLSMKAKSRFSIFLRSLSQPMSLGDIARTWDACAHAVISEHAQQSGGGSFSSRYGTWENCLSAA